MVCMNLIHHMNMSYIMYYIKITKVIKHWRHKTLGEKEKLKGVNQRRREFLSPLGQEYIGKHRKHELHLFDFLYLMFSNLHGKSIEDNTLWCP